MKSDCEERNKQMFLKMKGQILNSENRSKFSTYIATTGLPIFGKSMKASFSYWYLKLDDRRINLSFLHTIRNSSDKEEMHIMRKYEEMLGTKIGKIRYLF